uniref:Transmembrane protein n=1 Tax=Panagrolaimus superbus TaxID=310955 RepID=A0A914Z7G0_9BILA
MGEKFLEIIRRFYFGCESTFDENDEKHFCCFGRVHVLTAAKYIAIFQYIFLALYALFFFCSAESYAYAIFYVFLNVGFTSILTVIFGAFFNYLSGSKIGWFKPHVLIFSGHGLRCYLPPFDTSSLNKEQIISIINSDLFSNGVSEAFLAKYGKFLFQLGPEGIGGKRSKDAKKVSKFQGGGSHDR